MGERSAAVGGQGADHLGPRQEAFCDAAVLGALGDRDHSQARASMERGPHRSRARDVRFHAGRVMARSTVREDALVEDVSGYSHAVLAYVGPDGYPVNVATEFVADTEAGTIRLTRPSVPAKDIPQDKEVNVIFSHVRPREGVGYDQRRYVSIWGT